MKHALLLMAVVAGLGISGRAYSQYMFLDLNGDGVCDATDALSPTSVSIDVWLDTDTDLDGSPAACNTGTESLTINSYEFFLHADGGPVTYGAWADSMVFGTDFGTTSAFPDMYIGFGSGTVMAAGLYKLGTLAISGVSASTNLSIIAASSVNPGGFTAFGTSCIGNDFDNMYKLGSDWMDVCGTAYNPPISITQTTWGAIKSRYH